MMTRRWRRRHSEHGECPACGCEDVSIRRTQARWSGTILEHCCCEHCGQIFRYVAPAEKAEVPGKNGAAVPEEPPQPLVPLEPEPEEQLTKRRKVRAQPEPPCPRCGASTRVASTRKRIRWHRCLECGETFKSSRASDADPPPPPPKRPRGRPKKPDNRA